MDSGLLYVLSLRGYRKLVTLVLAEGGADVNAQGGLYGNVLQAASDRGDAEIVRQLLERGADVNAQGERYGKALQAASYRGHAAIVQLLERADAYSADVHRPYRQKEVIAEMVLEDAAKCLALRTYISLHLTLLWLGAILPLTGWLILRFLRS